jgi:hypothetical protein
MNTSKSQNCLFNISFLKWFLVNCFLVLVFVLPSDFNSNTVNALTLGYSDQLIQDLDQLILPSMEEENDHIILDGGTLLAFDWEKENEEDDNEDEGNVQSNNNLSTYFKQGITSSDALSFSCTRVKLYILFQSWKSFLS